MQKLTVLAVLLISFHAGANKVENYNFPSLSALEATFSVINLSGPRGKKIHLGQNKAHMVPAGYTSATRFNYRFYQVSGRAPLVFLNIGLGGDANSGPGRYLASMLHRQGYHVVVLGSTFRDDFAALASSSPYVGQTRIDAYDLYTKMISIKRQLLGRGVQVSKWGLTGYSFGALVAAHMAGIDQREGYFNFSKVVLLSPPVDLLYSMKQLDRYHEFFDAHSVGEKAGLAIGFTEYINKMIGKAFSADRHRQSIERAELDQADLMALVGKAYRETLKDVIFYSQQKEDVGIIPAGLSSERKRRSARYGYYDYVSRFMARYLRESIEGKRLWERFYGAKNPFSLSFLNRHNSLYGIESTLRNNQQIVLFQNADDFLIRSQDIDFLQQTLGRRLLLFPAGGHLGNFWFVPFQNQFLRQWQLAFR